MAAAKPQSQQPDPVDTRLNESVNQYLQNENFTDAIIVYTEILKKEPKNALALAMRAQVYACMSKMKEMEDDLKNFVTVLPNWPKTNVTFQGWLRKIDSKPARRWFQLKGKYLFSYVTEKDSQIDRGIYMYNFTVTPDNSKKERFTIEVPSVATLVLEAESEENRQSWLTKLELLQQQISTKICFYVVSGKEKSTGSDWIFKQGGKNSAFKRRWCVLKGNMFYYYEHQQDPAPKGVWDLKDCELGRVKESDPTPTRYRWKVTLKDDKESKDERLLYVTTSEKRELWLNLFLAAKECNLKLEIKAQPSGITPSRSFQNKNSQAPGAGPSDSPSGQAPKRPQKPPDPSVIPPNRPGVGPPGVEPSGNKSAASEASNLPEDSYQFDGHNENELIELVSPRPYTNCYLSHKVYEDKNIEKERNIECLKSTRSLGLDEEWDEGESDWISGGEEIDEEEGCLIM